MEKGSLVCSFCGKVCSNLKSLIQHEIRCRMNPNRKAYGNFSAYNHSGIKRNSWVKGRIYVHRGSEEKAILREDLKGFLSEGYLVGRSSEAISRIRKPVISPEKEQERRKRISETMKKNPKAGGLRKGSGRGKKCWYESPIAGRVYLRSTYELEYCKYLDQNNIRWKQNQEGFKYEFEGKIHKYFPDFILLDEGVYVEIKGFKRKNDEAKWQSFPFNLKVLY